MSFSFFKRKNEQEPVTSTLQNPITQYGSGWLNVGKPQQSTQQIQGSGYASNPTTQIQGSGYTSNYASNPSNQIQGSGYTSNYVSNPMNYKAPNTNPRPVATPTAQKTVTTPTTDYLSKIRSLGSDQANRYSQSAQDYAQRVSDLRDRSAQRSQSLIPQQQQAFSQFKQNIYDQIAGQQAQGEEAEQRIKNVQGEALRRQAQANRENQAGLQNLFAGLGTVDSTAFQNQASRQTNEFTRQQAEALQEQANLINENWRAVDQFKRDAATLISQEEANLNARIVEIQNTIDSNSANYDIAIQQAYDKAAENIGNIQNQVANAEYAALQKEYEAKLNAGGKATEYETALRTELFNRAKENGFADVANSYSRIINAPNSSFGDIARITAFMKMIDPGSTVRETEFSNAQEAAGLLNKIAGIPLQVTGEGILTDDSRMRLRNAADSTYSSAVQTFQPIVDQYVSLATQQGANPINVIGEFLGTPGGGQYQSSPSVSNDLLIQQFGG